MDSVPKVNILLSTFNGAKYLPAQIESILAQTHRVIKLTIRDDGSTDSTVQLLRTYSDAHPSIKFIPGVRLGVPLSFYELVHFADDDAQYYAFADQDDVWHPSKIDRAVTALRAHASDTPLLYCGRLEYVDSGLRHLGFSPVPNQIGFHNALIENIAAGCTAVMNQTAMQLFARQRPQINRVHDHWLYLVVSAFGQVIFDPMPVIKYRQHSENVVGAPSGVRQIMASRAIRLIRHRRRYLGYFEQADEFNRLYGDLLPSDKRELLVRFVRSKDSIYSRLRYAVTMGVRRQNSIDNTLFRLLVALGAY